MGKYSYRSYRLPAIFTIVSLLSLGIFITVLAATYDLTTAGSSATIDGTIILQFEPTTSAGAGNFNTYLVIQKNGTEQGYNTGGSFEFDEKQGTIPITLSGIPQTIVNGILYREFQLDLNESSPLISLNKLQFFTAASSSLTGYNPTGPDIGGATDLIWDMDASEDNTIQLKYLNAGSGEADYIVLVPESKFQVNASCYATPDSCYVYQYVQMGDGGVYASDDGTEEWGRAVGGARINPAIDIEKTTNGWTDDVNPVNIMEGTNLTWEYTVTNTGDVTLTDISVTDDQLGAVCTITSLDPGASQVCYMYGTAGLGLYQNIGTATGDYAGLVITDQDPSSYNGLEHTAVTLSSVSLTVQPQGSVTINWETESEMETIGFNLYRTNNSSPETLGMSLTYEKAQHPGDITGAAYSYIDIGSQPNIHYYYWIEEVFIGGSSDLYGPFEITTGLIYIPLILK